MIIKHEQDWGEGVIIDNNHSEMNHMIAVNGLRH